MSAVVDDADRPAGPSSDTPADATVEGAGSQSSVSDGGTTERVDPERGLTDGDAPNEKTAAEAAHDSAVAESAADGDGASDHVDAEDAVHADALPGDVAPADTVGPGSSGAQVVQDAPAPTRAQLRIDFGAHLEANYRRLVAQLYAITLDPAEAHSVVQDAYSRAWRSWAAVSRTPDPTGWVRRVAVRSTIRSWRRLRPRQRRIGPVPDTSVGAVLAALRSLPAPERRCVVLHHMAASPLPEIAAVEGASVGTTAARLARAQQVVTAGLAAALSDVLDPDESSPIDGWAAQGWDERRPAATGAAHNEEDLP